MSLSQNWSSNGGNSFYVTFSDIEGAWKWIDLFRIFPDTFENGDYTLELDVYNNTINPIDIVLFNETNVSIVKLASRNDSYHVIITGTLVNTKYVSCRCISQQSGTCYFDNVKLSKR